MKVLPRSSSNNETLFCKLKSQISNKEGVEPVNLKKFRQILLGDGNANLVPDVIIASKAGYTEEITTVQNLDEIIRSKVADDELRGENEENSEGNEKKKSEVDATGDIVSLDENNNPLPQSTYISMEDREVVEIFANSCNDGDTNDVDIVESPPIPDIAETLHPPSEDPLQSINDRCSFKQINNICKSGNGQSRKKKSKKQKKVSWSDNLPRFNPDVLQQYEIKTTVSRQPMYRIKTTDKPLTVQTDAPVQRPFVPVFRPVFRDPLEMHLKYLEYCDSKQESINFSDDSTLHSDSFCNFFEICTPDKKTRLISQFDFSEKKEFFYHQDYPNKSNYYSELINPEVPSRHQQFGNDLEAFQNCRYDLAITSSFRNNMSHSQSLYQTRRNFRIRGGGHNFLHGGHHFLRGDHHFLRGGGHHFLRGGGHHFLRGVRRGSFSKESAKNIREREMTVVLKEDDEEKTVLLERPHEIERSGDRGHKYTKENKKEGLTGACNFNDFVDAGNSSDKYFPAMPPLPGFSSL